MSVWESIFDVLEQKDFSVFPPAVHIGECTEKYLVVKDDGRAQKNNLSTEVCYYSILCYVPKNQYSTLDAYVDSVKIGMKDIYPKLMPTGYQSPSFFDDEVKAYMVSIQYRNNVKNNML